MLVNGVQAPARANLGLYTQPLSIAGIPIVSAPLNRKGKMPMGIQFATAPGREQLLFQLLARLESEGILRFNPPE
jgi:aspartyl-tRNA(Asn)/glutamyl-tRNA(Gln) amidotransferase subunit A